MKDFIQLERISLRNSSIKEDSIQQYIYDNPSVLGLGDLTPVQRERIQPAGGRLDLLLASDEGTRYEVEIMLGATDPSHIIRTIEYWDTEKKRYPQYDHCAVIVAEEITGRFMNVISLFNGAIPLIALQMSAYKVGEGISITFTKVIDRITLGTDEEDEYEVKDRHYWENRSTSKMMKLMDTVFSSIQEYAPGFELKYNKFYVGLMRDGIAKNFIYFKPKKSFVHIFIKSMEDESALQEFEDAGMDVDYVARIRQFRIKFTKAEDYTKNKELIDKYIKRAMQDYNALD